LSLASCQEIAVSLIWAGLPSTVLPDQSTAISHRVPLYGLVQVRNIGAALADEHAIAANAITRQTNRLGGGTVLMELSPHDPNRLNYVQPRSADSRHHTPDAQHFPNKINGVCDAVW
jgi:hypothetical protein